MRKTWAAAPTAVAITPAVHVRPLCEADETTLGQLMWSAFHESADDADYGSPADAHADVRKALRGHWGPVCWEASLAAELEARMVAELHLAVARGNPAVRLYQRLGFAVVP